MTGDAPSSPSRAPSMTTTRHASPLLLAVVLGCHFATPEPGRDKGPTSRADPDPALRHSEVTGIIAGTRFIDTTRGISEVRAIDIGGIKQWISIRGKDRRNPILLFVHGGPGSPEMPTSWVYQSPWGEYFTVVQWDQRGAGKTAASNDPAAVGPTITVDRMTADGEEVVRYLRTRFGKAKIFLLGHSWGTVIGVNIAQRHPEWLHAYIGMGQAVYGIDNERIGYEYALGQARARDDRAAITDLEKIAPYPNTDGTIPIDKILVQRKWVIAYGGLTWGRSDYAYAQDAARLAPEYDAADLAAMNRSDLTALKQLLDPPNVLDYRNTTTFKCPVFILAGRHDYETVSEVAFAWYQHMTAPMEEPGKLFDHLLHDIRPLAVAVGDAASEPN